MPSEMPRAKIFGLVTKMSSPTSWIFLPSSRVASFQPSQSSSARPSSIETMGYWRTQLAQNSTICSEVRADLSDFLKTYFLDGAIVELARGGIDGDGNLLAGLVAGGGDGFEDALEGFFVGFEIGREAAFVADGGGVAVLFQHGFQIVEDFDAPAQGLVKARSAERHHHEFLHVDGIIGVRAAIENVHHRDGKRAGRGIARILSRDTCRAAGRRRPQRRARRPSKRRGWRSRRTSICSACRRRRSCAVERALVGGVEARRRLSAISPLTLRDGLAARPCRDSAICRRRAVRLASCSPVEAPEGTAARPHGAAFEANVRFDRGIAAGIENLAAVNGDNFRGHRFPPESK